MIGTESFAIPDGFKLYILNRHGYEVDQLIYFNVYPSR